MHVVKQDAPAQSFAPKHRRVGLATRLFGCHHKHLSLPRSNGDESYRECIRCGARRDFNPETWLSVGPYYFAE
jgi:hypothetical protein